VKSHNGKLKSQFIEGGLPTPALLLFLFLFLMVFQIGIARHVSENHLWKIVLINEWGMLVGVTFLVLKALGGNLQILFPLRASSKEMFWLSMLSTLSLCFAIDILVVASETLFPSPATYKDFLTRVLSAGTFSEGIWKWFLICLTPAFCEEFFFRGVFQTGLLARIRPGFAITLTAFCFSLLHGNFWYFHFYFILGLYLSWLAWKSKNLWIPIWAHLLNNSWTYGSTLYFGRPNIREILQPMDVLILIGALVAFYWFARRFSLICKPA